MTSIFKRPPNVYTMPPEAAFMESLYEGIKHVQSTLSIPTHDILLFLPTRRAIRAYQECVLEKTDGMPSLLPKLRALGDLEEADLLLSAPGAPLEDLSLPPAIPPLKRLFLLHRLIREKGPKPAIQDLAGEQSLALAEELVRLLDQVNNEGLDAKALRELYPQDLSAHWQIVVDFLDIVLCEWPKTLEKEGFLEPVVRRNQLISSLIAAWQKSPPAHPVIVAGSTGSVPAMRDLLKAISSLPKGAVILPGLDTMMDAESWDIIGETHPQYTMKRTLGAFNILRAEVSPWPFAKTKTDKATIRLAFAREALRPFETTGAWHRMTFDQKALARSLDVVECPTLREEAGVIALMMRGVLEKEGKTCALVTQDRGLAALVRTGLGRWGITVDDSAGRPLTTTPAGTYFMLLAAMVFDEFSPVSLLAFLKHPYCIAGLNRDALLKTTRLLDQQVLRGVKPAPGLKTLIAEVKSALRGPDATAVVALLANVEKLSAPLTTFVKKDLVDFADMLAAHVEVAFTFGTVKDGQTKLWQGDDGEALADFLDGLQAHARDLGLIARDDYPAILKSLMDGVTVRPKKSAHPKLFIWGVLESRLQQADLVILGGLNEDSWPPKPADDPWMSREMRTSVGLPTPDQRVGQSANDFMMALGTDEVVLTRAQKVAGTPATPSRWLQRMKALLKGYLPGSRHPWLPWYLSLDSPETFISIGPPRPAPPVVARPRQLSVTKIETWMRDPYAIYARHVLGLEPLEGIEEDPSALEKGTILHEILERFMKDIKGVVPEDGLDKLIALGRKVFTEKTFSKPAVKVFWQPRFETVAEGFIATQLERQKTLGVVANEVTGTWKVPNVTTPFTLTAKADRIDKFRDSGALVVIDYKTGEGKPANEIRSGHSPQLPLEGVMLEASAFKDVPKAPVKRLEYWTIGNPMKPAAIKKPIKADEVAAVLADAKAGLQVLITAFDKKATPYLATPDPERPAYGDYDHLARLKEWQNKGDIS